MNEITSAENAKIKLAASLARASVRKKEELFLIEGEKLIAEALQSGLSLTLLFIDREQEKALQIAKKIEEEYPLTECFAVPRSLLEKICEVQTPQGMAAVAKKREQTAPSFDQEGRYLLLENVQNPGNVGTMLRTAEAFAVSAVLLCGDCADPYAPKTVRGSMGAAFRIPFFKTDVETAANLLQEAAIPLYTAELRKEAVNPAALPGKGICIAIGNEGAGITKALSMQAKAAVEIPMAGKTESLSAPISAAVLMWEMWRGGEK